jgi:hypothetical protein
VRDDVHNVLDCHREAAAYAAANRHDPRSAAAPNSGHPSNQETTMAAVLKDEVFHSDPAELRADDRTQGVRLQAERVVRAYHELREAPKNSDFKSDDFPVGLFAELVTEIKRLDGWLETDAWRVGADLALALIEDAPRSTVNLSWRMPDSIPTRREPLPRRKTK